MKAVSIFLVLTVMLTGLLAGIGFVGLLGFTPTLRETPAEHLVPYWQIVDKYMGARMPVFGMLILASFICTGFFLVKQKDRRALWFLVLALVFILTDLGTAMVYNFPFNKLIQSVAANSIPNDFEYYRNRSAFGFDLRSICMIGSFISSMIALVLHFIRGVSR